MDYEKAYKESFEAAKGLHEAGNALTKMQMEVVFPQLAESDDERTRKEIIHYLFYAAGGLSIEEQNRWIAYLEKQKELFKSGRGLYYYDGGKTVYMGCPATEENPYDFAMKQQEEKKEPHFTKRNALFDKCVENCDPEIMKRVSDEVDEMLQKEQKPVQSNVEKEYVRTLKSLISDFLRGKEEVDREYYQQIFDWLDGRHIEQKPAEWSEEDENIMNDLISLLWILQGSTNLIHGTASKYANWLKSLRPQPHWKPSEEQMKALLKVVDKARELHYSSNSGYDEYDVLRLLYKQLKKLI